MYFVAAVKLETLSGLSNVLRGGREARNAIRTVKASNASAKTANKQWTANSIIVAYFGFTAEPARCAWRCLHFPLFVTQNKVLPALTSNLPASPACCLVLGGWSRLWLHDCYVLRSLQTTRNTSGGPWRPSSVKFGQTTRKTSGGPWRPSGVKFGQTARNTSGGPWRPSGVKFGQTTRNTSGGPWRPSGTKFGQTTRNTSGWPWRPSGVKFGQTTWNTSGGLWRPSSTKFGQTTRKYNAERFLHSRLSRFSQRCC
jgi:hypothetical protein